MAVVNLELPFLALALGLACALVVWLLGVFTSWLHTCRYRIALAAIAFPLSGLMGFFCTLKFEISFFGEWFSAHPAALFLSLAYCGYLLFGFLGCWTAVRIGSGLDRKHNLSVLYTLLENRKKTSIQ